MEKIVPGPASGPSWPSHQVFLICYPPALYDPGTAYRDTVPDGMEVGTLGVRQEITEVKARAGYEKVTSAALDLTFQVKRLI